MAEGGAYLTHQTWGHVELGEDWRIIVGTAVLFDFGIYLAVAGATLMVLLNLMED
jgi:hypothetical protein